MSTEYRMIILKDKPPDYVIDNVAKRICGDIIWSEEPGRTLRRWREIYGLSQSDIAKIMNIKQSVVSDYERGRREPGRKFIKQYIRALLQYDANNNWTVTKKIAKIMGIYVEGLIDVAEFLKPISIMDLIDVVKGIPLTTVVEEKIVKGYTIIDSIRTIEYLASNEFVKLMGVTSDRALIFTNLTRGRSPLVAVKVSPVKPVAVVLHGIKKVDKLAIIIAVNEKIPLILAPYSSLNEIIYKLRKYSLFPLNNIFK